MTRPNLWLAIALLLAACGKTSAVAEALDGTLTNWYPDGYLAADGSDTATVDATVDAATDAIADADAVADASDATADTLPDLPDAVTADGLADAATADSDTSSDDAADIADVSDVADVPDAADVPDVPDAVDAPDTGPGGICFKGGPPVGDAYVADVPATDPATCPTVPPTSSWFTSVPPPTLDVTPGFLDTDGNFKAYQDNDWVPLIYGMQGSFHVWAGFSVDKIPNATAATLPLDVQIWGDTECVTVASGVMAKVTTVPTATTAYSNVFVGSSGVPTQFYVPAASSYLYCGIWLSLHIRVHDPVSGAWGEGVRTLRLYDSKP